MKRNKIVFTKPESVFAICNDILLNYIKTHSFENKRYILQSGNGNVYTEKDEFVYETICGYQIKRLFHTFHQNDDIIRDQLYPKIMELYKPVDNLLLIGGECYIYGKILKYEKCDIYTDFESIYLDAKRNCDANVYLIDYKKHKNFGKYDMCIVNIGIKNLIDTFSIDCIIFYISCNSNETFENYKIIEVYNIEYIIIYKLISN